MADGEIAVLTKLEVLKEIRSRTLLLEKLRCKIKNETDAAEKEEKCLAEYKSEVSLLLQEKAEHVELLRLIHSDINNIESIIKQSDDECKQSKEKIRRLLADYQPIKKQVDELRASIGLGGLVDADVDAAGACVDPSVVAAPAATDPSCSGVGAKRKSEDAPRASLRAAGCRVPNGSSPDADPFQQRTCASYGVVVVSPAAAPADGEEGPDGKLRVRQQLPPMKRP